MSAKLKPCPFCGNDPVAWEARDLMDGYQHSVTVFCETCGIEMTDEYESEVTKRWNTRKRKS